MTSSSLPDPRRWWILVVLSLSLIIISLDNTILNVALPAIREDIDATSGQLQWIVDAYMLVFAGLLLTVGSLGDRFGRKRMLTFGLIVFGLASAAASFANDPATLIACRALMGIGGAAIMPSTLSILTNVFPAHERPKAIAAWAAVSGLGIVIGPVTGGFLVEHADWSWVFLVNVPLVLVALVAGRVLIPESKDPAAARLDVPGVLLSFTGLVALVWGIIESSERGWGDPAVLGSFGLAVTLLAAFAIVELRSDHPMLELRLFRNARFGAASASITFAFFALFGMMFFLTQYFQNVLGKDPLEAGLWALPAAAGMMLAAGPSARIAEKVGTKIPVVLGLSVLAAGLAWLSTAGVDEGFWFLSLSQLTIGAGIGLAMAPATESIMGSLPLDKASVGSAVNDTNRVVGGALGVAILGSLLSSGYRHDMEQATQGLPHEAAAAAQDSVAGAVGVAAQAGGEVGANLHATALSAFTDAMGTATLAGAGVALAGAVLALVYLPAREARKTAMAAVPGDAEVDVDGAREVLAA